MQETVHSSRKQRSRWKKRVLWSAAVLAAAGSIGGWWMIAGKQEAEADNRITWVTVSRGDVEKRISMPGTLNPSKQVTLTSGGKVVSVYVKTGQKVKKGQKIAQLDTSSLKSQLRIAEAKLDQAEARLDQVKAGSTVTDSRGRTVNRDPDPHEVRQAKAAVDQAEAEVDSIKDQIADSTVTSPIDGTVLQVIDPLGSSPSPSVGSGISAGSGSGSGGVSQNAAGGGNAIAVIADLRSDRFVVEARVSQSDAAYVKAGQNADISVSTDGNLKLTGVVTDISYLPQTENGVTTYPVILQVKPSEKSDLKLLPGTSVTAEVSVSRAKNVLRLPVSAMTQRRGQVGVLVENPVKPMGSETNQNQEEGRRAAGIAGEGLKFVPVTVGLYGGDFVEIKGGLKEGDRVAIFTPVSQEQSAPGSRNAGMGLFRGFGGGQGRDNFREPAGGRQNGGNRSWQ